jgi:hypothetical protein
MSSKPSVVHSYVISTSNTKSHSYANVVELFEKAFESFNENLPLPDQYEFDSFRSDQSMGTSMQEMANTHPVHRDRLSSTCRTFVAFTHKLESCLEVATIFVPINPDYMSVIRGSLRLIFQVSENIREIVRY